MHCGDRVRDEGEADAWLCMQAHVHTEVQRQSNLHHRPIPQKQRQQCPLRTSGADASPALATDTARNRDSTGWFGCGSNGNGRIVIGRMSSLSFVKKELKDENDWSVL